MNNSYYVILENSQEHKCGLWVFRYLMLLEIRFEEE